MSPRVILRVGQEEISIAGHTVGGLTGSRTAGFLGRIPVESVMAARLPHWKPRGFRAGDSTFCVCTWVDNLFSASTSLDGAVWILEDFENCLNQEWNLQVKPSSRNCMVARGNQKTPADPNKWPLVEVFPVLGHLIQENGSVRACWNNARRSMWRAFWANSASREARNLSFSAKWDLMGRSVTPQLNFRCSRWPPQKQIADELDTLQQKMSTILVRVPRSPGEDAASFVRRRGRIVRKHCKEKGLWSVRWFQRAVAWDNHLARPGSSRCWSARLRNYHGRDWLMQRRLSFTPSTGSTLAGRTCTRAFPGKVFMRWHDGIELARSVGMSG